MKSHISYSFLTTINQSSKYILCLLIGFSLFLSCKTTKYVPNNEYLLHENKIAIKDNSGMSGDDVMPYIYQKVNRRMIFGIPFYLDLYNMSPRDTSKWVSRTLRDWGEPPVILDTNMVKSSVKNIQQYLRTQGFYHATVDDTIVYKKKKATVQYTLTLKRPYRINKVTYDIPDTTIRKIVIADTLSSLVRQRRRLSNDNLDNERNRLTTLLRSKGYYAFNKGYITYQADTTLEQSMANIKMAIANYSVIDKQEQKKEINHTSYVVRNVYIYTNFDPVLRYSDSTYMQGFDTLYTRNLYLIYDNKLDLRPGVIQRTNLILPNTQYNEEEVNQTYNNFSNLRIFKSVNIQFTELNQTDSLGNKLIDCVIQLSPLKSQSAKVDLEGSISSSNLIGVSPGLHYGHRNLFKGAEQYSLDFRGVFQFSFPNSTNPQTSFEYNITSGISIPKFLAPFQLSYFKKQIPHTKFTASYTYQRRPDYTRSVGAFSVGYLWNNSAKLSFILNPIDFNMVKMLYIDPDFYSGITDPYLKNTYDDHFILGLSGSVIYTNQGQNTNLFNSRRTRRTDTYYFRVNGDIAGNLLSLFNEVLPYDASLDAYTIFGTRYSQYAKIDFSYTFNKVLTSNTNLVSRVVFGIGKPYGNDISLPFEKMFYAGGSNSLRGWLLRGVGPGSAPLSDATSIPNQVGDMRFEANIEYRFPLFWLFDGATFIDAGNIWSINPNNPDPRAVISSRFYKEIAMNTGLGLRLNVGSYFVFRFDLGLRFYDPALDMSSRFIAPTKWLTGENYVLHIGVNYPF